MIKIPSLNYNVVIKKLNRDNWKIVRQKGSYIRLEKYTNNETLKLTIPAHKPIKRSTLSHIIKQAKLTLQDFLNL